MYFDELSSTSDSVSNMSFVYSDALTHQIQNILQGRTNNIIKITFCTILTKNVVMLKL